MFATFLSSAAGVVLSACVTYDIDGWQYRVINVSDAHFDKCGPGISVSSNWANVTITDCTFSECSSPSAGGGISFTSAQIRVFRSSFMDCTADSTGSAIHAVTKTLLWKYPWNFSDNVVTDGTCERATIYSSDWEEHFSDKGTDMAIERMNITSNKAKVASAFALEVVRRAVVQFCHIESNGDASCVLLNKISGSASIRSLIFRENTCGCNDYDYQGMFCIFDSWKIRDSVFQGNKVGWIVGQYATSMYFVLTFENCQFDAFTYDVSGDAVIKVIGGSIGHGDLTVPKECRGWTMISYGTRVCIVVGVVASVAVLCHLPWFCCRVMCLLPPHVIWESLSQPVVASGKGNIEDSRTASPSDDEQPLSATGQPRSADDLGIL
jgi:hypothetical protein